MRSGLGWLCLGLLTGACGQFIGLDEYRKVDGTPEPGAGTTAQGGSAASAQATSGASGAGQSGGSAGAAAGKPAGGDGAGRAGQGQPQAAGARSDGGAAGIADAGAGGEFDAGSGGTVPVRGGGGAGGTAPAGGTAGTAPAGGTAGTAPVCTTRELLLDGNFEGASTAWVEAASNPIRIRLPAAPGADFPARSPSFAARLGGFNGTEGAPYRSRLHQHVTIPANATELNASCYYRINTLESPTGEFDSASVVLEEIATAALVVNFRTWVDRDATTMWTQFTGTLRNTSSVAGRQVAFALASTIDESFVTAFYFDSCSLTATVCS